MTLETNKFNGMKEDLDLINQGFHALGLKTIEEEDLLEYQKLTPFHLKEKVQVNGKLNYGDLMTAATLHEFNASFASIVESQRTINDHDDSFKEKQLSVKDTYPTKLDVSIKLLLSLLIHLFVRRTL